MPPGMLIYRTQRNQRKRRLKLFHGSIMLFVVTLVVIALVAVFDSHNLVPQPIPNMYSLHSWVGLTSVILFCCQVQQEPVENYNILNSQELLYLIGYFFSGSLDFCLSSIRAYNFLYALPICPFTCTLASRDLSA